MTADASAEVQARLRVKRKNYFVCAAVFAGNIPVEVLLSGRFEPALVLVLLVWSASFVLLGVGVGGGWVPMRVSGVFSGLIGLVALTALIQLTGGVNGPHFGLLSCVPVLVAMYTPDTRLPTWLSIGATLGALLVLQQLSGMEPRERLRQTANFGAVGLLAAIGAQTYRRMREAEKAAQRAKLEALEALADSERRRLRAERERAEVERLVLVGQLAAGVAHEVNNPLAFVKSNLCFLEQELLREGKPPDMAELCDVIAETQQGVLRIQQIVTDLRRFSREADGHEALEDGAPEEAMGEARRLASVRLRSLGEVVVDVAPGLPRVGMGQRHLVQVLMNLLLNAADAVEGAVPSRRALILLRARRMPGGVRLEVEDNGTGISEEVLPRLFEPFFTTKPPGKGTGLGLALCHEYISRAGGKLLAENRPEGGARFVLTLPEVGEATQVAA